MNNKTLKILLIIFLLVSVATVNAQSITFEKENRVMIKDGRRIYLDSDRVRNSYINCNTAKNRLFHGIIRRASTKKPVPFFPILNKVTFESFYSDSEGRYSFTFPSGCPATISTITRNAAGAFIVLKSEDAGRDEELSIIDGTYMIAIDEYLPVIDLEKQLTKDYKWISWSDSSIQSCAAGKLPPKTLDFHAFSLHSPSQTYTSAFIEGDRFEIYQKKNEATISFAYESLPGFKLRLFLVSTDNNTKSSGEKCSSIALNDVGIFTQETILKKGLPKSIKP